MFHTIDSDTPFDVVFLYFWGPGDIPYQDGSKNIIKLLDCITEFGIVEAIGLEKIHHTRSHKGLLENSLFRLGFKK